MMIQRIIETQSAFGQKPRSFQQNGLLENRLGNFKKLEKLGLEELSIEELIDQGSMKA